MIVPFALGLFAGSGRLEPFCAQARESALLLGSFWLEVSLVSTWPEKFGGNSKAEVVTSAVRPLQVVHDLSLYFDMCLHEDGSSQRQRSTV